LPAYPERRRQSELPNERHWALGIQFEIEQKPDFLQHFAVQKVGYLNLLTIRNKDGILKIVRLRTIEVMQ
jgi:hypothetical protein